MIKDTRSDHFLVLDCLRGVLALWVVVAHIGEFAGYSPKDSGALLGPLLRGALAVNVFIILSGFLIARLIIEKREPYFNYIIRRACRLWPAFIVVLALAILSMPLVKDTLSWHSAEINRDEALCFASTTHYFWIHLVAGVPMLQGLVPDTLLPKGSFGFLPPAWSISLEWQFYLVAPLLIATLRRRVELVAVLLAGCVIATPALEHFYPMHTILPMQLGFFSLGIVSYWFWSAIEWQVRDLPIALALGALALLPAGVPLAIWLGAFALLFSDSQTPLLWPLARAAAHPMLVWLGEISYSVYLVHYPLIRLAKAWMIHVDPGWHREEMALFLVALTLPLTLGTASALYTVIEKPGINLGRKLTRRSATPDRVQCPKPQF